MKKHQCVGKVVTYSGLASYSTSCQKNATHLEDGKWWCGHHAPSKRATKAAEREAAYQVKRTERERRYAQVGEDARKLAIFDGLLAAAEKVSRLYPGIDSFAMADLREAVAEAKGVRA